LLETLLLDSKLFLYSVKLLCKETRFVVDHLLRGWYALEKVRVWWEWNKLPQYYLVFNFCRSFSKKNSISKELKSDSQEKNFPIPLMLMFPSFGLLDCDLIIENNFLSVIIVQIHAFVPIDQCVLVSICLVNRSFLSCKVAVTSNVYGRHCLFVVRFFLVEDAVDVVSVRSKFLWILFLTISFSLKSPKMLFCSSCEWVYKIMPSYIRRWCVLFAERRWSEIVRCFLTPKILLNKRTLVVYNYLDICLLRCRSFCEQQFVVHKYMQCSAYTDTVVEG
jgi:hypothetical protein